MRTPPRPLRRRALPILGLLTLAAAACFEKPVEESLAISLDAAGAPSVQVLHQTRIPSGRGRSPEVVALVEDTRERLLRGDDPWTLSLRRVSPARESVTYEWENGELLRTTRRASLSGAAALEGFLRGVGISASLSRRDDLVSLELFPAPGGRATVRQRERAEQTIDRFAEAHAAYLKSAAAFLRYSDRNPRRASALLSRVLSKESMRDAPLEADEESLAADLEDRVSAVLDVLSRPGDEAAAGGNAYSPDEEVLIAYEPFPARVSLTTEATVLDAEGFERRPDGDWAVPEANLLTTLRNLGQRWVSPDLLVLLLEDAGKQPAGPEGKPEPLDSALLAERPRRIGDLPDAATLKKLFRASLAPRDAYRLRLRVKSRVAPAG